MKHPLRQSIIYLIFAVILFSISSCEPGDSDETDTDVFWKEARLDDFPLSETEYLDIEIVHPVITNEVETEHGKIEITVPFSQTSLMLSLKRFDLDNNKYNISPTTGDQQDFSNGFVTYTIFSTTSQTKAVHYDITVKHGGDPFFVNAKITGFKFEKSKNPQLSETIEAFKIAEYPNYSEHAIYVIVPEGTPFSGLVPTVTYDAAKIFYDTDNQFVLYNDDITVDFTYPKHFYLQAENSLGTKSLRYNVIVDVANPINITSPIVTSNVTAGDGGSVTNFFAIAQWTNQGNHPITGMSPVEYRDKTYPIPDYPGNANIITTSLVNPNGGTPGVLPGQQGQIHVTVKRSPIGGSFSTTAVFKPTFNFDTRTISYWPVDDRIEGIFEPQSLIIQTMIVE